MENGDHVPRLLVRRLRIDTHQQPVVYLRADSPICRSEGFGSQSRIRVEGPRGEIVAVLNVIRDHFVGEGEIGLSEAAWRRLGAAEGDRVHLAHAEPVESMSHVRAKIYGHRFDEPAIRAVIADISAGRYADVDVAAFVAACGGERLDLDEITALTFAMIGAGRQLRWDTAPIVDKHCVGGLPGNRTSLIVVPIVAAAGLKIPKTSSRAITSPAGTADTMEVLAPVALSLDQMRAVVEREGGCVVWGGSMELSPADDVLVRVERTLDIDSEGQLVASVLSKKAAAGSTHVVLDLPVGPTAKVRSPEAASRLAAVLEVVGRRIGLDVRTVLTDGTQPVGEGIGPALEARDVVRVLTGDPLAPRDLRARGILLAGRVLELAGVAATGDGEALAAAIVDDRRAWAKFRAICDAQGGLRDVPPPGEHLRVVHAPHLGVVRAIDNRGLARVAKLAGAPEDPRAGIDLHVHVGTRVEAGQPLFTVHAESPGELAYALHYLGRRASPILVEP